MKKTMLTKMLSTVSSAILLSAMAASALTASAAGTPNSGTGPDTAVIHTITAASTAEFTIGKDIVLFNVDGSTIYEPNITYTYTADVATVKDGTTIKGLTTDTEDGDATVTVSVHSGVADVVTIKGADKDGATGEFAATANLQFGDDNTNKKNTLKEGSNPTSTEANVASRNLTVKLDASKFTGDNVVPGVYRYVITDTTAAETLIAAGIRRDSDYDKVRYLDVYTKYNAAKTGLEIYGYVFLKGADANTSLEYDKALTTETIKVTGFDTESETGTSGDYSNVAPISDQYHTYNVQVNKVVEGELANATNNFPFKVELTNATVTSADDFYYVITKDGTQQTEVTPTSAQYASSLATNGSWTLDGATAATNLQLQHGDSILITGLPAGTKIKVTETNNTADTYTVSAKDTDDKTLALSASPVAPNGSTVMNDAFAVDNTTAKDTITFTNTLKEISVTGVAFTVAPFALILFAGVILYAVYAKNRKKNSEDII